MIEYIVHTADWHLKVKGDHDKFDAAYNAWKENVDATIGNLPRENTRIVIAGDFYNHRQKEPSNIAFLLGFKYLKELLDEGYYLIVIIGNHDYDTSNPETMDCLTPLAEIFKTYGEERFKFLKHSECIVDDDVIFAHYSNFDNNKRPDIEKSKEKHPEKTVIGLFHDIVVGSKNHYDFDVSSKSSHATSTDVFKGCDFVIMGDIHKHQVLTYNKGKNQAVYSGSLFQLEFGESVTGHGYCLWDVPSKTFEFKEIDIDYGLYKITIESIENPNKDIFNIVNL